MEAPPGRLNTVTAYLRVSSPPNLRARRRNSRRGCNPVHAPYCTRWGSLRCNPAAETSQRHRGAPRGAKRRCEAGGLLPRRGRRAEGGEEAKRARLLRCPRRRTWARVRRGEPGQAPPPLVGNVHGASNKLGAATAPRAAGERQRDAGEEPTQ